MVLSHQYFNDSDQIWNLLQLEPLVSGNRGFDPLLFLLTNQKSIETETNAMFTDMK